MRTLREPGRARAQRARRPRPCRRRSRTATSGSSARGVDQHVDALPREQPAGVDDQRPLRVEPERARAPRARVGRSRRSAPARSRRARPTMRSAGDARARRGPSRTPPEIATTPRAPRRRLAQPAPARAPAGHAVQLEEDVARARARTSASARLEPRATAPRRRGRAARSRSTRRAALRAKLSSCTRAGSVLQRARHAVDPVDARHGHDLGPRPAAHAVVLHRSTPAGRRGVGTPARVQQRRRGARARERGRRLHHLQRLRALRRQARVGDQGERPPAQLPSPGARRFTFSSGSATRSKSSGPSPGTGSCSASRPIPSA